MVVSLTADIGNMHNASFKATRALTTLTLIGFAIGLGGCGSDKPDAVAAPAKAKPAAVGFPVHKNLTNACKGHGDIVNLTAQGALKVYVLCLDGNGKQTVVQVNIG